MELLDLNTLPDANILSTTFSNYYNEGKQSDEGISTTLEAHMSTIAIATSVSCDNAWTGS